MRNKYITIIAVTLLLAILDLGVADVLPNPVPEKQLFTTNSIIDAVGSVQEKTDVVWQIGDAGLTSLANPRYNDNGNVVSGSIAYATYLNSIMSNNGQISEVKFFTMDTQAKTAGMYNLETEKVLTYTSQSGSHLMGAESYVLDIAGGLKVGIDDIICVFSQTNNTVIPAFCNKVAASSKLSSITTTQVETVGALIAVADKSDVPAALKYEISVTPDVRSASGYTDGIVSTTFTVSVMEGRSDGAVVPVGDPTAFLAFINAPPAGHSFDTMTIHFLPQENGGGTIANPRGSSIYEHRDNIYIYDDKNYVCLILNYNGVNWERGSSYADVPGLPEALSWISGGDGTLETLNAAALYRALGLPLINDRQTWNPRTSFVNRPATADELTSTLAYIDTATVVGGISTFNKQFNYQSGIACENC